MYGAFGKKSSHTNMSKKMATLDRSIQGVIMVSCVNNHGIKAKKRFQLRNKKSRLSVK
jgi:hypothetical protein